VATDSFAAPIETVFFTADDGVAISGFYIPRKGVTRSILFLHGNAGNASHRLADAVGLWSLDANVLLLDYRGYGLSKGRPSEQGVYLDGNAGLKYLTKTIDVPEENIVIFGRSLGTAVALDIAQNRALAGLILVSPLSSGKEVARASGLGLFSPFIGNPFDSINKIDNIRSPVVIFHGDQDRVLPFHMGKSLFERAKVRKTFHMVSGAGHNDLIAKNPRQFFSRILEFLNDVAPRQQH
jgi:hypothetical protein